MTQRGVVNERGYLSIGEVLALLQDEFPDVTISKIRFLESQGLIDPERTPSGYRKFYEADIERLRFILREQKEHFLPLRVIKDRLASTGARDGSDEAAPPATGATAVGAPVALEAVGAGPTLAVVGDQGAVNVPAPPPASMGAAPPPVAEAAVSTSAAASVAAPSVVAGPPISGEVRLSFEELAAASGLSPDELTEIESYGLVSGRTVGRATHYDEDALVAARTCAAFLQLGIEPRHLRLYRNAADREAGLVEQVILPFVKQRNPQARAEARRRLDELVQLGGALRTAMLRQALRSYLDG